MSTVKSIVVAISLVVGPFGAHAQTASRLPGKPVSKPLPDWCQHGECMIPTIEYTEPVLFHSAGVLFRVEGESWTYSMQNPKKKSRLPCSGPTYVFCSKQLPSVISAFEGKYLVDFLILDDNSRHGHANAVSLSQYFAVCHGRIFDSTLSGASDFANTLGYKVRDREDQPTINRPHEILNFLPKT